MANNITVKDALSVNQVVKTTDTAGVHTTHQNVDALPPLPVGANHIGTVDIDNAAGASAVNVQDGGNSLTVDNTVLSVVGGGTEAAAQRVTIANDSTGVLSVDDNGASLTVDGTVAVSSLPALVAGSANIGDVDVLTVPMLLDGSSRTIVVGTVAPDNPVGSSSPVQVGVEARTTDGTPVNAAGDLVRPIADTLGKQVVLQGAVHDRHVNGKGTFTNTTAADVIAAGGAGVRIAVTSIAVTNAHATVGTKVEIRDGTTVKVQLFAAAAGGGWTQNAGGSPLFISTANTAVTARCVTTGSDVDVSISGYTIAN